MGLTGVLAAAIRRVHFDEVSHRRLVALCRMLFGAYALHGRDPMIYERTPVLAGQCFYLFATEGNPDDKALVEAAYELDVTSRPSNARAQATVALRDYTYARFHGDLEEAARQAEAAIISLARFRLPRHLRVVTQQGYLAA